MHWVCLSPALRSKNHNVGITIQRTVMIVTKIVCLHSVWVNQINVSVFVPDKQHLRAINKCSNSRYSLPVRQTTCSFILCLPWFLFFSLVPSQSLHLPFLLSFALSLSFTPPPPLALLQCALIGWKLVSNHFNFFRVGYTIGYLNQTWAREKGRAGGIPLSPVPTPGRAQWAWLRKLGPGRLAACLDRTGWSRSSLFGLEAFRD